MEDEDAAAQQEPLLGVTAQAHPAWYTPKRLLALFSWLTFLIYLDQGLISSNGVNQQIQVQHLNNHIVPHAVQIVMQIWLLVCTCSITCLVALANCGTRDAWQ